MPDRTPTVVSATSEGIALAATALAQGQLVAFPTETVYGLGADARNGEAVAGIYAAKGRPSFNPLIVHLPNATEAQKYCHWPEAAQKLAEAFWPGPLSLVLPLRAGHGLSSLVTAGLDTVAIRVPAHPAARALLAAFDGPVAAPSANPSGRISPTTARHVQDGLGNKVAVILDDGPCTVGLESTIVGMGGAPSLLRPGGVPIEAIEDVLEQRLLSEVSSKITAPGQLSSHYAPNATVRLNATIAEQGEVLLGFGGMACDLNLSASGNLVEAAANLFGALHKLDATGNRIAVAPIPETGLGVAINDRLRRAAAPKPG